MTEEKNEQKELELIQNKFEEGLYSEVVTLGETLFNSKNKEIISSAHSLVGLAQFKQEKYNEASKNFKILTERNNAKPEDWFNLCTSSTLHGDYIQAESAYKKTLELTESLADKMMFSFYYLQALQQKEQYTLSFNILNYFKDIFIKNKITDFTHLTVLSNGIPPDFSQIIETSEPTLLALGKEEAETWLNGLAEKIDEEGREFIENYKKQIQW